MYVHTHTQEKDQWEKGTGLKGFKYLKKLLATIQKQDVFLKAPGMPCLGQLIPLGPFVFCALSSCGAWPPSHQLARPPSPGRSTQTLPTMLCVIQNAESEFRQQRQAPSFSQCHPGPLPTN